MAYCTIQQLEDRLTAPMLALRVVETGDDRTRVLESYIDRASARIDSVLSVRYAVPVTSSAALADICLSFCIWQIEADRGSNADKLATGVQVPYDDASKLLHLIAAGKVKLPGIATDDSASAGLQVSSQVNLFSPDSPGMSWF